MRLAFVLRLGNDTRPADDLFEGWVEEVDSSIELRFRSTEQLLKFLGERFDIVMASNARPRTGASEPAPAGKKKNSMSCPAKKKKQGAGSET